MFALFILDNGTEQLNGLSIVFSVNDEGTFSNLYGKNELNLILGAIYKN